MAWWHWLVLSVCGYFAYVVFQLIRGVKETEAARARYIDGIRGVRASQRLHGADGGAVLFDEQQGKLCLVRGGLGLSHRIISVSDLLGVEIVEDGHAVTRSSGAGIAVPIASMGVQLGAFEAKSETRTKVTGLQLRFMVRNTSEPNFMLELLALPTVRDSATFKQAIDTARRWHALLAGLIEKNEAPAMSRPDTDSIADQLAQLADLRNQGVLLEDEFLAAKRKLLTSHN